LPPTLPAARFVARHIIPQLCWRLIAHACEWNELRTAFAEDERARASLLHMAHVWFRLAEEHENEPQEKQSAES
jgi:hypothetical protein